MTRVVFLLGPARSGTTLLQRIIGDHPQVATVAEPYLLNSMLWWTRDFRPGTDGGLARAKAMEDLVEHVPGGRAEYLQWVGRSATDLYGRLASGAEWFLDKTPAYASIAHLLPEAFPDAAFILLWRNPLAVVASYLETWNSGRWNPYKFAHEYHRSLRDLVAFRVAMGDRALSVQYEPLVRDPMATWSRVAEHLDLDVDGVDLERAGATPLGGRMGDPTGQHRYDRIMADRADAWVSTWSSPVRRRWAAAYVEQLGDEVLSVMGYTKSEVLAPLRTQRGVPPWLTVRDAISGARGLRRETDRLQRWFGLDAKEARSRLLGLAGPEPAVWPREP